MITVMAASIALFVYDFSTVFTQFLSMLVILLAPWAGVFVVDFLLRQGRYVSEDLLRPRGGTYWYGHGIGWRAMTALAVGVIAGALVANTSQFQGFIAMDYLGGADLSPFVGFLLGAGIYYALSASRALHALPDHEESK